MVFTIGHSTRSSEDFLALLKAHRVQRLIDVRTMPRSRHNPQFNIDVLPDALRAAGMAFLHLPGLGGMRKPLPDSINRGWRNRSFQGYADHMQSEEFSQHLHTLMGIASNEQVAVMCAEAVPWRCHRSLIGDALLVHGFAVEEIIDRARRQPHRLTAFAQVAGATIAYPAPADPTGEQRDLFAEPPARRR